MLDRSHLPGLPHGQHQLQDVEVHREFDENERRNSVRRWTQLVRRFVWPWWTPSAKFYSCALKQYWQIPFWFPLCCRMILKQLKKPEVVLEQMPARRWLGQGPSGFDILTLTMMHIGRYRVDGQNELVDEDGQAFVRGKCNLQAQHEKRQGPLEAWDV